MSSSNFMNQNLANIVAFTLIFGASTSFASFEAGVFAGSRTSTVKYLSGGSENSKSLVGTEVGASLMLSPSPKIPVSFGLLAQQSVSDQAVVVEDIGTTEIKTSDMASFKSTTRGTSTTVFYGPSLKIWVPNPKFKPYLQAAYLVGTETLDSDFTLTSPATSTIASSVEMKAKKGFTHTTTEIAIGCSYLPFKATSIFAEFAMHLGKRKAKSLSGTFTTTTAGESTTVALLSSDLRDRKSVV